MIRHAMIIAKHLASGGHVILTHRRHLESGGDGGGGGADPADNTSAPAPAPAPSGPIGMDPAVMKGQPLDWSHISSSPSLTQSFIPTPANNVASPPPILGGMAGPSTNPTFNPMSYFMPQQAPLAQPPRTFARGGYADGGETDPILEPDVGNADFSRVAVVPNTRDGATSAPRDFSYNPFQTARSAIEAARAAQRDTQVSPMEAYNRPYQVQDPMQITDLAAARARMAYDETRPSQTFSEMLPSRQDVKDAAMMAGAGFGSFVPETAHAIGMAKDVLRGKRPDFDARTPYGYEEMVERAKHAGEISENPSAGAQLIGAGSQFLTDPANLASALKAATGAKLAMTALPSAKNTSALLRAAHDVQPISETERAIQAAKDIAKEPEVYGPHELYGPHEIYGPQQPVKQEPPKAYFEVAPGKTWDEAQQQEWETLHPQAKQAISNKMIGEHISDLQRLTGITGEVREGLGGFGGHTNPNFTFEPYDSSHIAPALNTLGDFFRQDAMMGAHAEPFENSFPAGVVRVHLPENVTPAEAHAVYETLNKQGLAEGHSTDIGKGTMDIISGNNGEEAAINGKKIDKALGGRYIVSAYPTNISFPEHGENYGIHRPISGGSSALSPSASEAYNSLKAKAQNRLGELITEAQRQGGGHEGEISFGDTLSPGQPHPYTVSALMPTNTKEYKGPPLAGEARNDISPSSHSQQNLEETAMRMYNQHPALWSPAMEGQNPTPSEALKKVTDFYTKNLLALWDRTPPEQRQTSRYWYRSAHEVGNAYAAEHGIEPRAAHGMMAVLSPQNPWDNNVTLAERVMDTMRHQQDTPWTDGMTQLVNTGKLPEIKSTKNVQGVKWSDLQGKTLREVLAEPDGEKKAAMWVRAFDEAHNPREYLSISPTGEFMGTKQNKTGSGPDTSLWYSYNPIQKAISIYRNPSMENINQQVGNQHKVREFYNLITNPHDPNAAVIDTHAVAAGEFLPHGSSSKQVMQNFGQSPDLDTQARMAAKGNPWITGYDNPKKTGSTGATGDFPVHAEAVRQAAWARGVHPSEMQSVTWEAIRTLFTNKSPELMQAAKDVWKQHAAGEISHSDAIDKIIGLAGGFKRPAWAEQAGRGLGKPTTGSYQRTQNVTKETPMLPRQDALPEPNVEEHADGGSVVSHALNIARQFGPAAAQDAVKTAKQLTRGRP